MNRQQSIYALLAVALLLMSPSFGSAGEVRAGLSSQEAFVGAPIILQIDVTSVSANEIERPVLPEIDGLKIESAGTPRQSSQVTTINGRRSSLTVSVSMQYKVTPMREGSFEIPPLVLSVDGRKELTPKFSFVATKSETGDLLFVGVEGKENQVYVGEPLELTLKIWIKPYRNAEHRVELDESEMWSLISENTSWGSFSDRMQELAENRQRPGGRESLRKDNEGNQQRYFLYTIGATIYPNRPGQIDAGDVSVIVDYPTSLGTRGGRRRGQLDSPFGNSPLSQMLDDDFFGSPFGGFPFGNSLSITGTRPIVAGAEVKPTEVIPVPSDGRPDDYRGTVGKYEIFTQIDKGNVQAGDPIQLDIGITGDGPMQLVQAPPLTDIKTLTDDFKISDQPLAGQAQGNTKFFSTTIRPLREGITEIPPIPLSFFNPETDAFQTVMSEPIPITVTKSDALSLDSIVTATPSKELDSTPPTVRQSKVSFVNDESAAVLVSQSPPGWNPWWLPIMIVPPCLWLFTAFIFHAKKLAKWIPDFRSTSRRCAIGIESAKSGDDLVDAIVRFVSGGSDPERAIGTLRFEGLYPQAAELESFIDRVRRDSERDVWGDTLSTLRANATELMQRIASARSARGRSLVQSQSRPVKLTKAGRSILVILLCGTMLSGFAIASEPVLQLEPAQQRALLDEATRDYSTAIEKEALQPEESKELFQAAASKYQRLVESGISNAGLFTNLGNAYLKSGQRGRAIAYYERAQSLAPIDPQLAENLKFARDQVNAEVVNERDDFDFAAALTLLRRAVLVGYTPILWTLLISSLVFWGLAIARTVGAPFSFWRASTMPCVLLLVSGMLMAVLISSPKPQNRGIVVAEKLTLRAGDGESFDQVATIENAEGQPMKVLVTRGNWARVQTMQGKVGWIPRRSLEIVTDGVSVSKN